MGDMADLAMDQAFDAWCNQEDLCYDEDGCHHDDSIWSPRKKPKTCKRCGKRGLTWGNTVNGWRLFEKNAIHVCQNNLLRKPLR